MLCPRSSFRFFRSFTTSWSSIKIRFWSLTLGRLCIPVHYPPCFPSIIFPCTFSPLSTFPLVPNPPFLKVASWMPVPLTSLMFCKNASTELINMAGGSATRGDDEVRFPPPFSVVEYTRCYRTSWDARQFSMFPPWSGMNSSLHDSTCGTAVRC